MGRKWVEAEEGSGMGTENICISRISLPALSYITAIFMNNTWREARVEQYLYSDSPSFPQWQGAFFCSPIIRFIPKIIYFYFHLSHTEKEELLLFFWYKINVTWLEYFTY